MTSLVSSLNTFLNSAGDYLLSPFANARLLGLALYSLVAGVLLLWVYGKVSMQSRIKKVKRGIMASLLESVLFRHDVRTTLGAQGKMFFGGFRYLCLAVPPLLILIIPCILLLAQLNRYFGLDGLPLQQAVYLKAVTESEDALFGLQLKSENENARLSLPVRDRENKEILWKLEVQKEGKNALLLESGAAHVPFEIKSVEATGPIAAVSTQSAAELLLFPDGPKLPKDISSFTIEYPQTSYPIFGLPVHWILVFFVLSLCSGLVASKFLKVEI